MTAPIIYNLFPRLAGTVDKWAKFGHDAAAMGFNWLYLNPVSQPGFSGSLYSVRDYQLLCQDFTAPGMDKSDFSLLKEVLHGFQQQGLLPIMDLVINHTAIDCPLVKEHPAWYQHDANGEVVHPFAIDPADSRKVTVWGDLAEIDNENSAEKEALWQYWSSLVAWAQDLGFVGFRCDAAYKVPAALWSRLIGEAKGRDSRCRFFAETLGCRLEEVRSLQQAGMDYLFNSSKYWNFDAPWALEQHEQFGQIAPSISFAESHDTSRLYSDCGRRAQVVRQRYMLSAIFSAGLLMPVGFEYGFTRQVNVVRSRPEDWEEIQCDFRPFIKSVNQLKATLPLLGVEGHLVPRGDLCGATLVLEKNDGAGNSLLALINKDWDNGQVINRAALPSGCGRQLLRIGADGQVWRGEMPDALYLEAAEIALLIA